jgi:hypothetical protein
VIGVAPHEPPDTVVNAPLNAIEATVIGDAPVFANVTL